MKIKAWAVMKKNRVNNERIVDLYDGPYEIYPSKKLAEEYCDLERQEFVQAITIRVSKK